MSEPGLPILPSLAHAQDLSESLKGSDPQFPDHEPGKEVGEEGSASNGQHMREKDDTDHAGRWSSA